MRSIKGGASVLVLACSGCFSSSSGGSPPVADATAPEMEAAVMEAAPMQGVEASVEAAAPEASTEAGPACVVPDGGVPCNPDSITCGSQLCSNEGTQYCCIGSDGGSCITIGAGSCGSGLIWQCDEAANCNQNEVCCSQNPPTTACGPHNTLCAPADQCTGESIQLCHSDTECGTTTGNPLAKHCIPQTCGLGARVGASCTGETYTVEACAFEPTNYGALPGCTAN
jgi:hypothetical protein